MAEGVGLENRSVRPGTVGPNPTSSSSEKSSHPSRGGHRGNPWRVNWSGTRLAWKAMRVGNDVRFEFCALLSMKGTPFMKAKTFDDDKTVEVEVLTAPSSTGLCKVKVGERQLVRHRNQLEPLDDEARELLKK